MRREIANIKDHYEKGRCKKCLAEWRKVITQNKERKREKGEQRKRKRVKGKKENRPQTRSERNTKQQKRDRRK